ncbi:MAG: NifB/NifX family molybdenum-iron cluster-binding protein [Ignavibacteria bacterium]|jgi:predicted Fe-Mo cluster-binding NifX family protein
MIAITVKENNINSEINDCFGKSEYFFLFNNENKKHKFIKNPGKEVNKMSGKKAALFLIKEGVNTIVSTNFGAEVKKLFDKHNIQMVIASNKYKYLKDINWLFN